MLEKGAFRVALLNYTYGTNGLPVPSRVSRERHRHGGYSPRDRLGPAGRSHSCRAVRSLGKRVRATARPPSARAGGGFPPLGRRSGDRIASACRAAGGNDRGFGRKRTRGDGLLDGQFRVEPAFPGYGRRPVGPRDADARRTGRTSCRPEYLIVWTCISRDPNSASGRRYDIVPSYSRETVAPRASRRFRPVRRAYAPAHGASRPRLYGDTMRLLMRRFLRIGGHGMRAAVSVSGGVEQGGAVPLWRNPLMTEC